MKFRIIGLFFLILWLLPPPSVLFALQIPAKDVIATDRDGNEKDLQSILDKILPTSPGVDLSALTASSHELNVLDGIDTTNVTAANLNSLMGGGEITLHSHPAGDSSNADTLDNIDSTQFLRSDTNDAFEGATLTIDGDVMLTSGATIASNSNGDIAINPQGTGTLTVGTSVDDTALNLRGDLTVSGTLFTPAMTELIVTTRQLEASVSRLQNVLLSRPEPVSDPYFFAYYSERGEGHLIQGNAVIYLSAQFLELSIVNEENPLFVKTTLLSAECNELAVIERTSTYFRVKELYKGTSSCPFLWEAGAKRRR